MFEDIKQLVLEGGGTKCSWQAGFIEALQEAGTFRPDVIWAVSASSGVACSMVAGKLRPAIECFQACMADNRKNMYVSNLFSRRPVFPQGTIYRTALLKTFDDASMTALQHGPDIQILLTRTCRFLPGYAGVVAGLSIYALRGKNRQRKMPRGLERFGFFGELVSVKTCRTPDELADLVLASSCTPPVTPLYSFRGRRALDGGLIENFPISAAKAQAGLILALRTTRGRKLEPRADMIVVEPSEEMRISSWEYTNPAALGHLFELGRRDGDAFTRRWDSGVQRSSFLAFG